MTATTTPSGPTREGWHSFESAWRCLKEYQFQHVRKIRQPQAQTPDYFAVGLLFHAARACWFSNNFDTSPKTWTLINEAVQAESAKQRLPVSLNAEKRALELTQLYMNHWSRLPKPKVLAAEYDIGPATLLTNMEELERHENGMHSGAVSYTRTARLDDVSRYPEGQNQLFIGESKTTSTSIADTVNQYRLHGQPLLQYALWSTAPQGEKKHGPVAGVMLDIIKKPYEGKKPEFAREPLYFTPEVREWFVKAVHQKLRDVAAVTWDTDVDRNPSACTRQVGRARIECPYRDLCLHGRSASVKYVFEDGNSLVTWKRGEGREVAPWL